MDLGTLFSVLEYARQVVEYLQQVKHAPEEKQKIVTSLIQARGLLMTVDDLAQQSKDGDYLQNIAHLTQRDGPISALKGVLEELDVKLGVTQPLSRSKAFFNRLTWPFNREEVEKIVDSLEGSKTHLILVISNDHVRLSTAILSQVHGFGDNLTTIAVDIHKLVVAMDVLTDRQDLMRETLEAVAAGGNSRKDDGPLTTEVPLLERDASRLEVDIDWFLQHKTFLQWYKGQAARMLLIVGKSGTGKTVLSTAVSIFLARCRHGDLTAMATIRLQYPHEPETTVGAILFTLLKQLLQQLPRDARIEDSAGLETVTTLTPHSIYEIFCRARRCFDRVYLIIDALDECEEQVRLGVIGRLSAVKPPISLLATTRESSETAQLFEGQLSISMDVARPLDDLLSYIQNRLTNDVNLRAIFGDDTARRAEFAEFLTEQSSGMFIYAKLYLDQLPKMGGGDIAAARSLAHRSANDLNTMYDQALSQLQNQPPECISLAKDVFRTLLEATEPVTVRALVEKLTPHIIAARQVRLQMPGESDSGLILACCSRTFVATYGRAPSSQVFRFTHLTAREYIAKSNLLHD